MTVNNFRRSAGTLFFAPNLAHTRDHNRLNGRFPVGLAGSGSVIATKPRGGTPKCRVIIGTPQADLECCTLEYADSGLFDLAQPVGARPRFGKALLILPHDTSDSASPCRRRADLWQSLRFYCVRFGPIRRTVLDRLCATRQKIGQRANVLRAHASDT
jgi:hypothetical protein